MSSGKVRVLGAVFAGYGFLFRNLGGIFRIAWLPGVLIVAASAWASQFVPKGDINKLSNEDAKTYLFDLLQVMLGASLFELLMTLIVVVGLYRLALYNERSRGFGYLRVGLTEMRVAGVWFLVVSALYIAFMAIVYVIVFFIAAYAGITALDPLSSTPGSTGMAAWLVSFTSLYGGTLISLYLIFAVFFYLWVYGRLFLAMPATVDRRAVNLSDVWQVTKGNGLRMVIYVILLLTSLIIFLMTVFFMVSMAVAAADAILIVLLDTESVDALTLATMDIEKLVEGLPPAVAMAILAIMQVLVFVVSMALWSIVVGSASRAYRDIMGLESEEI